MLFDTHAHYDDERFDGDREALLAGMPEKNVGLIVNPGCDISSSRTAVALAESFDFVYAAVGIHPENCGDFEPGMIDRLRQMAKNPRVVAIGEIGLDYYWAENPPRELQQEVLRRQLRLAEELGLPVIIHDRDAHGDTLEMVREFPRVRGVFHCFAGSAEMARELIKMGSAESQIALFSYRIAHLTEHVKKNRKDYTTTRALTQLVGKRRALLDYLYDRDINRYRAIIKALGLRK